MSIRMISVISSDQAHVENSGARLPETGQTWVWQGEAVRVDGPPEIEALAQRIGAEDRPGAARIVRHLMQAAITGQNLQHIERTAVAPDPYFTVSDGAGTFTVTFIQGRGRPLFLFHDRIPPKDTPLEVVEHQNAASAHAIPGLLPGTLVETPIGPQPVEDLREGDWIKTRDSGIEQIEWIGRCRISARRLADDPALWPVCIAPGALGEGQPQAPLRLSPQHPVLITGKAARDLGGHDEILVPAGELVNGDSITVERPQKTLCYVQLLLPSHQIILCNGVEAGSLHPGEIDLAILQAGDRARLLALKPGLEKDAADYGDHARHTLARDEAVRRGYKLAQAG